MPVNKGVLRSFTRSIYKRMLRASRHPYIYKAVVPTLVYLPVDRSRNVALTLGRKGKQYYIACASLLVLVSTHIQRVIA